MGLWRLNGCAMFSYVHTHIYSHRSRRALPGSVEAQKRWRIEATTSEGEKLLMTKKRACLFCVVVASQQQRQQRTAKHATSTHAPTHPTLTGPSSGTGASLAWPVDTNGRRGPAP